MQVALRLDSFYYGALSTEDAVKVLARKGLKAQDKAIRGTETGFFNLETGRWRRIR